MNGSTNPSTKWTPYLLSVVRFVAGFLFIQHGLEKLWGFAGGRIDRDFTAIHGIAGLIETPGGLLLMLGLFARPTAFILCGEMAVAYFHSWAPHGFWPIANGGEGSVIYCYVFLWLVAAGAGPWSLDALIQRNRQKVPAVADWETYARSILRIIVAFTFTLHGYRLFFGFFAVARGGRRGAAPMALDSLPHLVGLVGIVGGTLLFLGLFTRLTSLVLCLELAAAYLSSSLLRAPWPIRNGGEEAVLYFFVFLYFAAAGAGAWSLDHLLAKTKPKVKLDYSTAATSTGDWLDPADGSAVTSPSKPTS
jgi:putative oxidoreductase